MSSITRYDADHEAGCMFACSDGDYILFEDYEDKLLDAKYDYDQLEKKYDKLVNKLGSLYQEA